MCVCTGVVHQLPVYLCTYNIIFVPKRGLSSTSAEILCVCVFVYVFVRVCVCVHMHWKICLLFNTIIMILRVT